MEAKTDDARKIAYDEFVKIKIVEKQLRIAEQFTTTKGSCKKIVCPHCDCITTNLKLHQKTLKCDEIFESKLQPVKYGTVNVSQTLLIKYREIEDKADRRREISNDYLKREREIAEFYAETLDHVPKATNPKATKPKKKLIIVN